ncbi:MAG: hypothetical protein WA208_17220 [Thermoanaerobaculia bacterium]
MASDPTATNTVRLVRAVPYLVLYVIVATSVSASEALPIWSHPNRVQTVVTYADIRAWSRAHVADAPVTHWGDMILVGNPYDADDDRRRVACYRRDGNGPLTDASTLTLLDVVAAGAQLPGEKNPATFWLGVTLGVFILVLAARLVRDFVGDLNYWRASSVRMMSERDNALTEVTTLRSALARQQSNNPNPNSRTADVSRELHAANSEQERLRGRLKSTWEASQREVQTLRLSLQTTESVLATTRRDLATILAERDRLRQRVEAIPAREAELEQLRRSLYAKQAQMLAQERHLNDLINRQKEQQGQVFMHLAQGGRL